MKHFCILLLLIGLSAILPAQTAPKLYLPHTLTLDTQNDWLSDWETIVPLEGKKHFVVQFRELPSEEKKEELSALGVALLHYLPDNAWFASAPTGFEVEKLRAFDLYAFSPITDEMKCSRKLLLMQQQTDWINIEITTFELTDKGLVAKDCRKIGARNVQSLPYANTYSLEIPTGRILELARLPFVYFLTEATPPVQAELTYRNTVGRANYLSSGINGMNYNGAGVTLAIEESGILDTLSIDFEGRKKERTSGNSVSGHKTGCFMNAGSAGNYDPKYRANAWGATIMSLSGSSWSYYDTANLRIASHSYGWGVSGGYWSGARDHDQQVRQQTAMMHFYSSGNQGGDTCNYGTYNGIGGWANLTGGNKQAKNIMAINNTNQFDGLSFGSVGPAFDGRIKPDLCIEGMEGTSYSSPKAAGIMAQLYQKYKAQNNGNEPAAGLIKAYMLNTADELYNPGPDFKTGFGRINARRSYKSLSNNQFFTDNLATGASKQHTLNVPANVKEVRVMLYWTDYEATVNAAKALVNNLDLTLKNPNNQTFLPWKLNVFPHPDSLSKPAFRGADSLNNVEQITLTNPMPGNYILTVTGTAIPQGPQPYFVVYEFLYDELTLTYPVGREHFVGGEKEIIRWDNYGNTANVDLEFSLDDGTSWQSIAAALPPTQSSYEWTVPAAQTGKTKVRVKRGTTFSTSETFNIMPVPTNLHRIWACGDSMMLKWNAVNGATGYRITRLGQMYMDSIGTTASTHFKLKNIPAGGTWVSVQAYGPDNALSRRMIAWKTPLGDTNCVPVETSLLELSPYKSGYYPDCYTDTPRPLKVKIQNNGLNSLTNASLKYQLNNGTIYTANFNGNLPSADDVWFTFGTNVPALAVGTYQLKAWIQVAGDNFPANDTVKSTIIVYPSATVNVNTVQNFDAFTNCSTAWGCWEVSCGLSAGWFNIPNTPAMLGDSIDWRTHNGATGTSGTGPDNDHTTGTNVGKYLYLETSGNNGSGCQNKEASLHSTCIDLTTANNPLLDFWYHAYGGSIGNLNLDVLSDDGWKTNVIPEIAGDQGNQWLNKNVNLSAFAGQEVVVSFRAKTGGGYNGDFALDDIGVFALPNAEFSLTDTLCLPLASTNATNLSANATTYTWAVSPPTGWAFAGGTNANSAQPVFNFTNGNTLYTLTLTATNAFGSDTYTQTVYVNASLQNVQLVANQTAYCVGDILTLTAVIPGFTGVASWQDMNNQLIGNGLTVSLPLTSTAQSGPYYCQTSNACEFAKDTLNITVHPQPNVWLGNDSTIYTNQAITLDAGAGLTYVWSNSSSQQTYTLNGAQTGVGVFPVWVQVTNGFGCKNSDTILITVNLAIGIGGETAADASCIYPNPNTGSFYLQLPAASGPLSLTILDASGKTIVSQQLIPKADGIYKVAMGKVAAGTYLLEIVQDGLRRHEKIVVW